jgi:hypothetical protein
MPSSIVQSEGQAWREWDQISPCIKSGDRTLTKFLRRSLIEEDGVAVIQSLLFDFIPLSDQSKVRHLLSISCPERSAKSVPLFSKENIAGFHSLVTGAFKGFAYAFLQIKEEYAKLVSVDYQALET